jgi:protein-tyrosine phosphatase
MVDFASRDGVDLTRHRARRLSQASPDAYDLLLVMEDAHLKEMAVRFPHLRARTMLLSHWIGGQDIADPINEDDAFNERVYAEIRSAVAAWSSKLGGANV